MAHINGLAFTQVEVFRLEVHLEAHHGAALQETLVVCRPVMGGLKCAGGTVTEICLGTGPCGELRYPSYQEKDGKWSYFGEQPHFGAHKSTRCDARTTFFQLIQLVCNLLLAGLAAC